MLERKDDDPKAFSLDEKWSAVTHIFQYSDISEDEKWEYYHKLHELD